MPFDWLKFLSTTRFRRRNCKLGPILLLEHRAFLSARPIGPQFMANSWTTDSQRSPSIAMDSDGDYVITWASGDQDGFGEGIFAQRYNSAGVPQGSEFQVNTFTMGGASSQKTPSVASSADGDFVIAWTSDGQDGGDDGIYAQRFNSEGTPLGTEFQVNSYTTGDQRTPDIAMDDAGNFLIAWTSIGQDGDLDGIYAQRFDSAGMPQGMEFRVNNFTTGKQLLPAVAMDPDGDFVITWESYQQNSSYYSIYAQRFNAAGIPQGSEFQANSITTGDYWRASVAIDTDGDFVISWNSYGHDGSYGGVYARRFNAVGTPLAQEFQVNTYTSGWQRDPIVAADREGNFTITWSSEGQDGGSAGIYAQSYDFQGNPIGTEFLVNSSTTGDQRRPEIAMDVDGDFVVVWEDTQSQLIREVYAQRFRASHPDNLAVWRSSRFFLDSNHSNTWNGSTDDTLNNFGANTDKPLVGDWNGDGYDDIGTWRAGTFFLDANGNGIWDGPSIDKTFKFGLATDTPLVGDWNKDGKDDIGVWRAGKFYLDLDGNHAWNTGVDAYFSFGSATDTPIIGDWNADGTDDIGIWRAGKFYLDLNGNRAWNSGIDGIFTFGLNNDTPLIGDWNGDGIDDIGVWRAGKFYRDADGSRSWNSSTDTVTTFGSSTDTPLIGYWRPKSIPGTPPSPALPPTSLTVNASSGAALLPPTSNKPDQATLASLLAPPRRKSDP